MSSECLVEMYSLYSSIANGLQWMFLPMSLSNAKLFFDTAL